jgi:hypothetical protein
MLTNSVDATSEMRVPLVASRTRAYRPVVLDFAVGVRPAEAPAVVPLARVHALVLRTGVRRWTFLVAETR